MNELYVFNFVDYFLNEQTIKTNFALRNISFVCSNKKQSFWIYYSLFYNPL